MLVLSRKKNESVFLNGNIRVVVVDVRGDKVQLGIEAPSDVTVYRSEVLEKMRRANQDSNKTSNVVTLDLSRRETVLREEEKDGDLGARRRGAAESGSRRRGYSR